MCVYLFYDLTDNSYDDQGGETKKNNTGDSVPKRRIHPIVTDVKGLAAERIVRTIVACFVLACIGTASIECAVEDHVVVDPPSWIGPVIVFKPCSAVVDVNVEIPLERVRRWTRNNIVHSTLRPDRHIFKNNSVLADPYHDAA